MVPGILADGSLSDGWASIPYMVATSKLEVSEFAGIFTVLLHSHLVFNWLFFM